MPFGRTQYSLPFLPCLVGMSTYHYKVKSVAIRTGSPRIHLTYLTSWCSPLEVSSCHSPPWYSFTSRCLGKMLNKFQLDTIQYNTIQYNTIQYNTTQCNAMHYNTLQYDRDPKNFFRCSSGSAKRTRAG